MKFTFMFLLIGFWACGGRPDPNLQLANPEAFAFDLGESWEVNASVSALGFAQEENDDQYSIKLSYFVDMVTPAADTLREIYDDFLDADDEEEFMDVILEAQLEIDSSFGEGTYKLIFNVKDEYSQQTRSVSVDFNLGK